MLVQAGICIGAAPQPEFLPAPPRPVPRHASIMAIVAGFVTNLSASASSADHSTLSLKTYSSNLSKGWINKQIIDPLYLFLSGTILFFVSF